MGIIALKSQFGMITPHFTPKQIWSRRSPES